MKDMNIPPPLQDISFEELQDCFKYYLNGVAHPSPPVCWIFGVWQSGKLM